ncbi:DEAD/DEAH box helicase [Spiroplasma endosymbiont of Othius punctulatus]|uniref:DEAD/DEAH box helicase n=1 Tax=Spiroplasma endosymbiont of Othius punctulatus TaxID=3066289 RepID=UPI0030D374BA
MNPDVLRIQEENVKKIIRFFGKKDIVTFKAPTGSGKTIMICNFIQEILSNEKDAVFIVSSLSKSELASQNHNTFLKASLSNFKLKPFLINVSGTQESGVYIPDDKNIYSLPRDLYKKNGKIFGAPFDIFLTSLKNKQKKIYLIKDECHIETNNLDKLSKYFDKTLNVSATPQPTKFLVDVELREEDAERVFLIKKKKIRGIGLIDELEDAVQEFIKLKKQYNNLLNINPCMIIQISNEDKGANEFKEIKKIVNDPTKNLHWMYLADDVKKYETNDKIQKISNKNKKVKWKQYARRSDSLIDVIISKMVITEGWDIPRACVLFQVRNTKSKTLTDQIVGRVRRNPILLNWNNYESNSPERDLASSCLIWGDTGKPSREFKRVKLIKDIFEVRTSKLKDLNQIYKTFNFDVNKFILEQEVIEESKSIFDKYRDWKKIDPDIQEACWKEITTFNDWINFSEYSEKISEESKRMTENYEHTIMLGPIERLQKESYFEKTNIQINLSDQVWEIISNEDDDDEFHFDSEAEKIFAKILSKLNVPIWARNYYPNSKIKFEYINDTVKSSYPDFVLTDKKKINHIFEVKSFNKRKDKSIDEMDYKKKVKALGRCYLWASKFTKQTFYIPILEDNIWNIEKYENGKKFNLTKEEFISSFT